LRTADGAVLRGGVLEPDCGASCEKQHAKADAPCQSAISHADAPSTFSLRRGLDSI
jgi:hypothetical protein